MSDDLKTPAISNGQYAFALSRMVKASIAEAIGDDPAGLGDVTTARYALTAMFLFQLCAGAAQPGKLAGVLRAAADSIDPPGAGAK